MNNVLQITNHYSWLHSLDDDLKTTLWKLLRCKAKDYYHNVRYKMKLWDGYDDFFKKDVGRFLTGLLPEVRLVLKKMGVPYDVKDERGGFRWAVEEINDQFLNEGPNPVKQLRDYQVDYVNQTIKHWRGLITSPTSSGKAQPLDSKVYTPSGPKRMGDIQVGDDVCTPSGGISKVIAVYPQGKKEVYRIVFTNGDSVECCAEHLWKIDAVMDQWKGKVKNTQYLIDHCHNPSGRPKYSVPLPSKYVFFESREVKIDPYLMGVLLGDDGITQAIKLSSEDDEILNEAESKFVPNDYKYNSVENRLSLIQGLMDTDGYVDKDGHIEFCVCSKQLAYDVKEIIESLGGVCRWRVKYPTFIYKGEHRGGQTSYVLSVAIQKAHLLFRLDRKKSRCRNDRQKMMSRVIKSIEKIGIKECQCILIDDNEHLYLTDHMIPTHNTNTMKAIIKALPPKTPTLILANKKSLIDQNYEEIKSLGIDWVGRLYGDEKSPNYITCATVQSAHLLKPVLPKIKVLIVDEVHEMMSKVPKRIYNSMKNAVIRVGMSATAFKFGGKDESQKFMVKGYFGPVFLTSSTEDGKLTTRELIDRDILSTADCTFYRITEPKLPYAIYLDAVTKGIAENNHFHKVVVRLAKKLPGRTLIIVERLEHGDRLQEMIPGSLWVRGEDKLETRKEVIDKLKNETEDIIAIATSGIFNTGINVFCHNLINAAGGQADHTIIQRFGRGLRRAVDKQHLQYYDFILEVNDYLKKHSWKRVNILEKEGHNVTVLDEGILP